MAGDTVKWLKGELDIFVEIFVEEVVKDNKTTSTFDMKFTFVNSGWEGSANDSHIFRDARTSVHMGYPHPLPEI
ncbi:hypothetical protein NE237_021361 [Protea cynaroides]|uniref:Uncharacterized protein n=1 Tax=Protea cynaroides TaxID=273540 RepID=A0A9Q0HA48_9MAGN|nr:hypothetical protein NE237_021361 [Protea cynaroides]